MARKRTKAAPQTETALSETTVQSVTHENEADPVEPDPVEPDPVLQRQAATIVQSVADSTRIEQEQPAEQPTNGFASKHAPGHIANPSSRRRETHAASVRKLPSTMSVVAGDLKVEMIDKGENIAGIGIRVVVPEGRTLTDAEKEVIRGHMRYEDQNNPPYTWVRDIGMWAKQIVRDGEFEDQVPPSRPIAVRLDCEQRVKSLAEDLKQLQADPVGFADMVQTRRENAANSQRIPD